MYSSGRTKPDYRSYRPPSKSANYERSRSNFDEICDETWPLDEVINKIDIKSDSDDESNYNRNIQTWRSGPQLISSTTNSGLEAKRIAGEGALYSSFTEGTRLWKDKQVRHHDYKTKKGTQFDLSTRYTKPVSSCDTNNNFFNDYSDRSEYVVSPIARSRSNHNEASGDELEDDSPTLRDVGIQCNVRKYNANERVMNVVDSNNHHHHEHLVTQKPPPPVRVIKSHDTGYVSTYSHVPRLQSPMRSIETRHKIFDDRNETPSTAGSDVIYSQVDKSAKTRNNDKHKNDNNINIIYKQPMNESRVSYRSGLNDTKHYDVRTKDTGFAVSNPAAPKINLANPMNTSTRSRHRSNEKEIIEETISLSNTSTSDDSLAPNKSKTSMKKKSLYNRPDDDASLSSSNYRRNSPARYDRTNSKPNIGGYATIEKAKNKTKKKQNANDENVLLANNSLRLKSSKSAGMDRLYKSNADLRDQYYRDETRGGLAAAYKNRQHNPTTSNKHRALSLSRMNAATPTGEDDAHHLSHCPMPSRHLSQTHLSNISSRCSDTGSGSFPHRSSRTSMQHERDPIVMYIPTVNHQRASNNNNADSPKLTSILRHNSTKSTATMSNAKADKKKAKEAKAKEDKKKSDKKKDLNRRHSMPKDTKFNWLSKFKLSKSNK